jgi:hypothetical protein
VPAYLARWGTHPSWARAIASPEPCRRVETAVSELLGVEDVLAFPTLTHTHNGVLPALAGEGTVLVDMRAHRTIHDAAGMAAAPGGDRAAVPRRRRRARPATAPGSGQGPAPCLHGRGQDDRSGGQRRADALAELARRALESGQLPQSGGSAPS